jgi:hypothetical protein
MMPYRTRLNRTRVAVVAALLWMTTLQVVTRQEIVGQSGYLDYPEIVARLQQFQSEHPAIAQAVNLNELFQTPLTAQGRALWALKISDRVTETEDEPAFVVDACHHGNEIVTPHAALDIAEVLLSGYGTNPDVTRWVDHYEIWLVPCVNPDGRVRRSRENSRGVNLNRNYPFGWGRCSTENRGPFPASEPEVQTMLALGARERPVVYVSYHTSGEEVLFPYRCARLAEPSVYYEIRDQYRAAMRYRMRLASSSGESFEHFYNQFGSIAFLTEIGTSHTPPFSQVAAIVERLRPGWQFLLDRGLGESVQGHVRNAITGEPVSGVKISLDEVNFTEGEARQPEPLFGRYHWILQPGRVTIRFTAPGFREWVETVTVNGTIFPLDVELMPQ